MSSENPPTQRAKFLSLVLDQHGAPYRWGAKGEDAGNGLRAFDCSGLVTWALHKVGGPDWRRTHNTDRLLAECNPLSGYTLEGLMPGDIVFYGARLPGGDMDASHVMVHIGAGVVFGASGGDSRTLTLADAHRAGASVRACPSIHYRKDLLAFRRLPFTS
jgi:murein DD-endopeptidase